MYKFSHYNFNVVNLEKSLKFYEEALGLKVSRRYVPEDNSFELVYLSDGVGDFTLELTYIKERTIPYNLGENEFHLALEVQNYESSYKKHKDMGIICYENSDMGIYFISDPDNYWIEIIPGKQQ